MKIIDKSDEFKRKTADRIDRILFSMANDIQNLAKMKVPQKQGHLQGSILAKRKPGVKHAWMVEAAKEYARYQEFGGDGRRVVRRYSTPGTGKFYLRDSGRQVVSNAMNYIRKELNAGI